MRKIIIIILCFLPVCSFAQTFFENFEANSFNWNTYEGDKYTAIIQKGLLHLETREGARDALVTSYSTLNPKLPFELEVKLMKTKLNDEQRGIGVVFNYKDDFNFDVFYLMKGSALYRKIVDHKIVRERRATVKYETNIKDHVLTVVSTPGKLVFLVSGIQAIEINYVTLDYSGIGITVWAEDGKQSADVDYIRFDQ